MITHNVSLRSIRSPKEINLLLDLLPHLTLTNQDKKVLCGNQYTIQKPYYFTTD